MPISCESLTDFRDRVLSWLKSWILHIRTLIWRWLRPIALQVIVWPISMYRLRLRRAVFIGVTGSCGKTTTKEMIAAVLSSQYQGHKSRANKCFFREVVRSILHTSRGYRFCVQEFGFGGIDEAIPMEKQFAMFKPQMGVVTTVGDDHISIFGSREAIAAEKGKLIAALPPNGTAILNADDPLVLGMQSRCQGRVLTYGLSPDAMLRAEDIRDDWPNRLSLTVLHEGASVRVQTQLCGAHLVPNILAAMAVGQAMGVSLQSAAAALAGVEPVPGRMCPIESPGGVTFIRDDVKAPVWTIPAVLDFMRHATAKRKIIILGTLSDYLGGTPKTTYVRVARQSLDAADYVFFVGHWASRSLGAKRHAEDHALRAFVTLGHINGFLRGFLEPGDLVLIKGSNNDQLSRIVSTWIQKTQEVPSEVPSIDDLDLDNSATSTIACDTSTSLTDSAVVANGVNQLVVGLGNPGKRFEQTPHNVGHWTLDVLAELLQANWSEEDVGLVANVQVQDRTVLLVKIDSEMNRIGPLMRKMADQAKLKAQDCVIIQDDIYLKQGDVRTRMNGSSGGHKGIQSIIAAFESEDIPRVKIGVGLPTNGAPVARYVLTPFEPSQRDTIKKACHTAAIHLLEIINKHPVTERSPGQYSIR